MNGKFDQSYLLVWNSEHRHGCAATSVLHCTCHSITPSGVSSGAPHYLHCHCHPTMVMMLATTRSVGTPSHGDIYLSTLIWMSWRLSLYCTYEKSSLVVVFLSCFNLTMIWFYSGRNKGLSRVKWYAHFWITLFHQWYAHDNLSKF